MHYVFGKINYGGLKHNSLYLALVGDRASLDIALPIYTKRPQMRPQQMLGGVRFCTTIVDAYIAECCIFITMPSVAASVLTSLANFVFLKLQ